MAAAAVTPFSGNEPNYCCFIGHPNKPEDKANVLPKKPWMSMPQRATARGCEAIGKAYSHSNGSSRCHLQTNVLQPNPTGPV